MLTNQEQQHIIIRNETFSNSHINHIHDFFEILLPLKYASFVTVGNREYFVQPNDYLFIMPGVSHSCRESDFSYCSVQVDLSVLREFPALDSILAIISPAILLTGKNAAEYYPGIHSLIESILSLYQNRKTLNAAIPTAFIRDVQLSEVDLCEINMYGIFLELLVLLSRSVMQSDSENIQKESKLQEYQNRFSMILNFIDNHFTENLSLDTVSSMANFSKFHFSRLFKEYTGETFYRYVNMKRIEYACHLLSHGNMTITDVGLASGYSSGSVFIRMFKQFEECTPKEYRARHRIPLS